MADRLSGEVTVSLGGTVYTLRLDFNALAAFEEATGRDAMAVLQDAENEKLGVRALITLVHAMMQEHHPDADLRVAGRILSEETAIIQRVLLAATGGANPDPRPAGARPA